MIIEVQQFLDLIIAQKIHFLILFFIVTLLIPLVWVKIKSIKYQPYTGKASPVTVIVPAHKENPQLFKQCLESIKAQHPDQFIVALDSNDPQMIQTAKDAGAELITYPNRVGKRQALADAWSKARNKIVVHVDSDTILLPGCLAEITRPFNDKAVLGVATHHMAVRNGSKLSFEFSKAIEASYTVNAKALNGGMVVVDGRCNAWWTEFVKSVKDKFLAEKWCGDKCQIGDDRFLSREAIKAGGKTVFQSTAKIATPTQPTFWNYVKQQLRWRRSGVKFWLLDLKQGVYPSPLYVYKCAAYYLAPLLFLAAIALDMTLFPTHISWITAWWMIPLVFVVGTILVTALRQLIYYGKIITGWTTLIQGLIGIFVMLPVSIYGTFTVTKQNVWGTRGYKEFAAAKGTPVMLANVAALILTAILCGLVVFYGWLLYMWFNWGTEYL